MYFPSFFLKKKNLKFKETNLFITNSFHPLPSGRLMAKTGIKHIMD